MYSTFAKHCTNSSSTSKRIFSEEEEEEEEGSGAEASEEVEVLSALLLLLAGDLFALFLLGILGCQSVSLSFGTLEEVHLYFW